MAYPPAYTRTYSFTDFETNNPGQPKPGDKLDAEYDAVANALLGTQNALALIQRADGELANASVGQDQLEPGLFDDIADGITADAEAAAAAAAASASQAATSAGAASTSAAHALTSENNALGAAAQAGVSQGIAQGAASDCAALADDAADSATAAANSANEAQGFRNEAQIFQDTAFDWAEQLEGPVMPAPPGWPEAVDDGMFSSKWWAIRARDYNHTTQLDFGTSGTDIGNAFDIWDAQSGNELPIGQVYATWGSPPHTYVLTDPSNPSDPASWTDTTGGPGPPNVLSVGTVLTGAPGSVASVTITGTSPAQVLNMSIPRGDVGATGPAGPTGAAGPPNALSVGTVTTGPAGSAAVVTITGTSPTQTINFTIPKGDKGDQGIQGIQGPIGPTGPAANLGDPTTPIGLVAVNGTAATAMRSDAAPALSQAIAPTWTGAHTFTGVPNYLFTTPGVTLGSIGGDSYVTLYAPASADERRWDIQASSTGRFALRHVNDAYSAAKNVLEADAAGPAVSFVNFGNATDNPTYNFLGTGAATFSGPIISTKSGTSASPSITINSPQPQFAMIESDQGVDGKDWEWRASGGEWSLRTINDAANSSSYVMAATRSGLAVTSISFGNATDNPIYNFLGTGPINFAGVFRGAMGSAAAPTYSWTAEAASGMFLAAGGQVGISANGNYRLRVTPTAVSTFALLDAQAGANVTNTLTVTVADNVNATAFRSASGQVIIYPYYSSYTVIQAYNAGGTAVIGMRFDALWFNFMGNGGTADIMMANRHAITDNADGWLRLNNSLDYTNGVYSPGDIQSGARFLANAGLSDTGKNFVMRPNNGQFTYGSFVVSGPSSGYHGLAVWDGGLTPTLMGNGGQGGLYIQADLKWIGVRTSSTAASCEYNLTAVSFQVASSRTLKRETGRITRAADILARLRPLLYRLLADDDREQLGLIAEEVHDVCPQLSDGKSVMYDRLALLLLADWQETHQVA